MSTQNHVLSFIKRGEELGIELPKHLQEKITKLNNNQAEIHIALAGGFSVGKTSLVAAWLGKRPDNMKISQAESSNEVIIYDVADKNIKLIDTPGLFGFKEHNIGEAEAETYHDMTRKYVSEANMLFYVLEPSNPIKAGHEKVLKWLFRDLNILPRTIFILNQFDQVANLEKEERFSQEFEIKKKTVTERLDDVLSLTKEEKAALTICAVAANPFGKGADYWEERREEFNQLSHLSLLQDSVDQKIAAIGGLEAIKHETSLSILRDVAQTQMIPALQEAEKLYKESWIKANGVKLEQKKLKDGENEIHRVRERLTTEITNSLDDLIGKIQYTPNKNALNDIYESEIGANACHITQNINSRYQEQLGSFQERIAEQVISLTQGKDALLYNIITEDKEERDHGTARSNNNVGKLALGGVAAASALGLISAPIAAIALPVVALFSFFGGSSRQQNQRDYAAEAQIAAEARARAQAAEERRQLQENQTSITTALKQIREKNLELLNAPDFTQKYFPQLEGLKAALAAAQAEAEHAKKSFEEIRAWAKEGRDICTQYNIKLENTQVIDAAFTEL